MGRRPIILSDMKTRRAGWILVLVCASVALGNAICIAAASAAGLGSVFADAYSAFAPLFSFYQSYADHLFQGTDVEVPDAVALACESFSEVLGFLHLEIQTQTASSTALSMSALVRLRSDAAEFCSAFEPRLKEMDAWSEVDPEILRQASEEGLFAAISQLNDGLDLVFTETFEGFSSEEARWRFAVTFAVRAIIVSETVERINTNLGEIFYGDGESQTLPIPVPQTVADGMGFLVKLSGRELAEDEASQAQEAAETVYGHFIGTQEPVSD